MRIVHFLWKVSLADGGVVRAVLDLCPLLARPLPAGAGLDVELLCCIDDDVPASWRTGEPGGPRVRTIERPVRGSALTATGLAQARQVLSGCDVVHLHGMWNHANTQIARVCRRLGKPYVWSPHGMLDDWSMAQKPVRKRVYMALVGGRLLAGAGAIHCTAQAELDQAGRWFPRHLGRVVMLPFDVTPFDPGPGPELAVKQLAIDPSLGPVVLFLSRLHHKKGVDVLIRACETLNATGTPCQLLIAGAAARGDEAYRDELVALAQRAGPPGRVRLVGLVTGELKASLFAASDVFCLPSSQENFGYVIVEALASGVPVVTTKQVALWPAIQEHRAGVICEDNRHERVVEALRAVLSDPAAGRAMGAAGRGWTAREFGASHMALEFRAMYEAAIARAHA